MLLFFNFVILNSIPLTEFLPGYCRLVNPFSAQPQPSNLPPGRHQQLLKPHHIYQAISLQ